jgi:hypothetical protein
VEDLYPTSREDGSLVDNESLTWLWNLKSSKTFKGENTSKTLLKREGGIFISPLTANGSKILKGNNEINPQNMDELLSQTNTDSDNREPLSETKNVHSVPSKTLQSHPKL